MRRTQPLAAFVPSAWISSRAADAAEPDLTGPPAELDAEAVSSPETSDLGLSDAGADLASASLELTGPIGSAVSLLEGFHTTTGLPWWAAIPITAVGILHTSMKI